MLLVKRVLKHLIDISSNFPMFSAKTYQKTVYLSFQCYFPCLGQNHWSLPAVYTVQFRSICHPPVIVMHLMKFLFHHPAWRAVTRPEFHQMALTVQLFWFCF